jgi:hypothetical protein
MSVSIPLSKAAESRLKARAKATGRDLPAYVASLVERFADPPTPLRELSGPIYERFLQSGMTDDQLGVLLDKAKHEARAEKRATRRR